MSASFTFGGVEVPLSDFSYSNRREPSYGSDLSILRQAASVASVEATIPIGDYHAFVKLLRNDPPGASPTTLARRVKYGGRKGRSALRRLFARAIPVELSTCYGARFRGRCVMISETDLRIRMSDRH